MKVLHVSHIWHYCFDDLLKEQNKSHSLIFVKLDFSDEEKSYRIVKRRYGVSIENVKEARCYQYDYQLGAVFSALFKIYKPDLVHIQVFSTISLLPILNAASSLGIKKILTLHDHSLICARGVCHDGREKCPLVSLKSCDCPECLQAAQSHHLSLVRFNELRADAAERIIHQSDKIICPSHHQREQLVRLFGPQDKFTTLYYGVQLRPPASQKKTGSKTTFGYLGGMAWNKGLSLIETALDQLKSSDFKVLMGLGVHPETPVDAACLARLKRNKKIELKENIRREDLYDHFFSQIDYLIIPSLWDETGPMTLFESFYYKVPVLVSNNPSMTEKISKNKSSRVFNNADELAGLMRKIIEKKIKKNVRDDFPVKSVREYSKEVTRVYEEALDKKGKRLFLRLGFACNNHCIFCVAGGQDPKEGFGFDAIKEILEKNQNKYDSLILSGGEPTVRKDFLRILELAYTLGYSILLQTNARMFVHEEFCKRIQNYNMKFSVNINGPNAKIHDATTNAAGSFRQTVRGIKNLQKWDPDILVKILLTKINYKYLLQTAQFTAGLGIKKIWFVFLTPYGSARVHFDDAVPGYSEVALPLAKALRWLKKNTKVKVGLEGFPYCCLNREFYPLVTEEVFAQNSLDGLIPESDHRIYNCKRERVFEQKQKFSGCAQCLYDKKCEGVYKEYVKRMGQEEFSPIVGSSWKKLRK